MTGNHDRKAAVLFSGGMDSAYAAVTLLESGRYDSVDLLHFSMGPHVLFESWAASNLPALKARYGAAVRFVRLDASADLKAEAGELCRAAAASRELGLVCLTCRLLMHLRAARYAAENGIGAVADGSNRSEADNCVEQRPAALAMVAAMYARHGVEYLTPVYELHGGARHPRRTFLEKCFGSRLVRQEMRAFLAARGFRLRWRWGDLHKFIQPWCLWGSFYIIAQAFLGRHRDDILEAWCARLTGADAPSAGRKPA